MVSHEEKNLLLFPAVDIEYCARYKESFSSDNFFDVVSLFIRDLIDQNPSFIQDACDSANFGEYLQSNLGSLLASYCDKFEVTEYDVLLIGVASLFYFVQCNWTGPFSPNESCILKQFVNDGDIFAKVDRHIRACISVDEELITNNASEPFALFLSNIIFQWISRLQTKHWWLMRNLYINQLLLDEPSPSLHQQLDSLMTKMDEILSSSDDVTLKNIFNLERIQIHLRLYSEISKAEPLVSGVCEDLKLDVTLTGKLGKRTRFQEKNIAQLALNINSENVPSTFQRKCSHFPKDQRLEDEIRLPEITFQDECENSSLSEIEQAAILAMFVLKKKSTPKDKLQIEELSPYLMYLLSDPKVWCIHVTSLLFRSRLEAECSRTVERSITQIQSLISEMESQVPPVTERLPFVFSSFMPPKWTFEVNLAKLLYEVGAVQSALEVYQRLQMWEEVVECFNRLKLKHRAAEIIREEMAKGETVKLWCLLGDATDDADCYEKAWQLSKGKSSRAQKHWALYYFTKKKYEQSVPHFRKSLEINSLQVPLWFNLGFAALEQQDWELSASAYRRYCSLEPDCFEAWNNMAKAYIKCKHKDRAFKALQEAVRCNYDNWKVWDNLMAVSTDCGDFNEVVKCYHRILDIKGKHVDLEVLQILVDVIVRDDNDSLGLEAVALKLFGRLTSMVMNDVELWKLYAKLTSVSQQNEADKWQKTVQYLQRAHRLCTQECGWETMADRRESVVALAVELSQAQRRCCCLAPQSQAAQHLNSAKLVLRAMISKLKKIYEDVYAQSNEAVASEIQRLEIEMNEVQTLLSCSSAVI